MPRKSRIQSGTGVYHVMMRGINRQRIFEDTEDHYTFLQCLSDGLQRLDKELRNAILSVSLCPIHYRSKLFRINGFHAGFVHSHSSSFKGSMDVRPSTLTTYVHSIQRRTSIEPLNVRP